MAPGANVRPAAPPCPRSQPTREFGELPACVWSAASAEDEFGAFKISQNTSGGRISRAVNFTFVKHLNDRIQADFFYLP